MKTSIEDLTLVQLIGEMKNLKNNLDVITKRFEEVSRQISFKIEIAENRLIENELINQPISKVEN
tara:strand:- start:208 stop:402 length:195 start_codon:yes stop_codon:yes gene_type:complete